MKVRNRRNKNIPPLPLPAARIAGLAHVSHYQLESLVTQDTRPLCLTQPPHINTLIMVLRPLLYVL